MSQTGQTGQIMVPELQPKRSIGKIVVSTVLGGVTAAVMAPTIAAVAPVGFIGLLASNVAAGILGSVTTKLTNNAIGTDDYEIEYQPYRAQMRFRNAIVHQFDAHLDPVIACIRSATPGTFQQVFALNLTGGLTFLKEFLKTTAKEGNQLCIRYDYAVIPPPNNSSRDVRDGIPPSDLPVYDPNATARYRVSESDGLMDGMAMALAKGAAIGCGVGVASQFVGLVGPLFERMFVLDTAGGINMVFSAETVSGVADPVCNLWPSSSAEDRAAYFVELSTEIQTHISRVAQCAIRNKVTLKYSVTLGIHRNINVGVDGPMGVAGSNATNEQVVWNHWESTVSAGVILDSLSITPRVNLPGVGHGLNDQPNDGLAYVYTGFPPYALYPTAHDIFGDDASSIVDSIREDIPLYAAKLVSSSGNATTQAAQEALLHQQVCTIFDNGNAARTPLGEVLIYPNLQFPNGECGLTTVDPTAYPAIAYSFLEFKADLVIQAGLLNYTRRLFPTAAFADYHAEETSPGFDVVPANATVDQWRDWILETAYTNSHEVGTAAMKERRLWGGGFPAEGVRDEECAGRGCEYLAHAAERASHCDLLYGGGEGGGYDY
ncbi:hypothetical protein BJY01DRAFT_244723 [Aspergillus pseudoustus]|uniref:Uncharacterized protein n=1 Tax=Aspergillus pseudoustus TaxID=1810923 RepID=A0ABR4KIK4_9EURO